MNKITRVGAPPALILAACCNLLLVCSFRATPLAAATVEPTAPTATAATSATTTETHSSGKPALFDVEQYVERFRKRYDSDLEFQTRNIYLMANAIKVYNSGVAYKNRDASHHLKLNEFSDRSPLELKRMQNHLLATPRGGPVLEAPTSSMKSARGGAPREKVSEISGKLEHKIEDLLAKHEIESDPKRSRRRKRQVSPKPPRELSMSDLVQDTRPVSEPARVKAKARGTPTSNNPHYNRVALEHSSMGLIDQQEPVQWWRLNEQNPFDMELDDTTSSGAGDDPPIASAHSRPVNPFDEALTGLETDDQGDTVMVEPPWSTLEQPESGLETEPDEIFSDLRSTNCFLLPRNQGNCGGCYAFAATSMMEYLYCVHHRKLVAFSEQYIIDCGKGRVGIMNGCFGGNLQDISVFLHNFGLELAAHYPYWERELECPYANDTDLKTTGFIRVQAADLLMAPLATWPRVLRVSPMFVSLATGPSFYQYGRGVDLGHDCVQEPNHAMVMIGHGREDGIEYWLLRNSHGVFWGEQGHYKLAKAATKRCILGETGYVFGTRDAVDFAVPQLNRINPAAAAYLRALDAMKLEKANKEGGMG